MFTLLLLVVAVILVGSLAVALVSGVAALAWVALMGVAIWAVIKGAGYVVHRIAGTEPHVPPQVEAHVAHARAIGERVREAVEQKVPDAAGHKHAESARPRAYTYLDVEEGATADDIAEVMASYLDRGVVGDYARDVCQIIDARAFRSESLLADIDARFAPGSLSWERFRSVAESALDAILVNCAHIANRVQAFDVAEWGRYEEFEARGGFAADPHPSKARLERWRQLSDTKVEMDRLRDSCEALLTELGRLAYEVQALSDASTAPDTQDIVEEVSRLVDETKFYR